MHFLYINQRIIDKFKFLTHCFDLSVLHWRVGCLIKVIKNVGFPKAFVVSKLKFAHQAGLTKIVVGLYFVPLTQANERPTFVYLSKYLFSIIGFRQGPTSFITFLMRHFVCVMQDRWRRQSCLTAPSCDWTWHLLNKRSSPAAPALSPYSAPPRSVLPTPLVLALVYSADVCCGKPWAHYVFNSFRS